MSAHRHEGCFVWVKVSLESKQTVGKCTCGSNTRSFCKEGVEPKRKEYRSAEVGECATEWIVWLKLFPLRVLGHPQEEFQVANRHRQSDAKGESRGDRERRKERMPAKAHVHLNDLQGGRNITLIVFVKSHACRPLRYRRYGPPGFLLRVQQEEKR
jgi:hypothetical protein